MAKLRVPIKQITRVNTFKRYSNKPRYIVIHYIGAAGQAKANADYFYNVNRNASAHYFIDKNVTYQVVEEDAGAWHVGDAASGVYQSNRGNWPGGATRNGYRGEGATNYNSIGIEMCQNVISGVQIIDWPIDEIVIQQTLLLTKQLMDKYNIPITNVIRHFDVSGKLCPAPWRGRAGSSTWPKWNEFKSRLAKLVESGESIELGVPAPKTKYNPQGLQEVDLPEYREPILPYTESKVGDTVTIRDVAQWYNPETKKYMMSPNMPNYVGKEYKVKEVKDVSISYSKKAYLLEGPMSWVLEQDLEETRLEWPEDITENTYTVQKGDYLSKIADEFDITVENIKDWNNLETNIIHTGMTLFVVEPEEVVPKDDKPNSTDDNNSTEPVEDQPEDKGPETPSIDLEEDEVIDHEGNVFKLKEGMYKLDGQWYQVEKIM